MYGLGTLLMASGLLLAGKAPTQAGLWDDWRRFTPLVAGVWTAVLIGLQLTKAVPTAVAIWGFCLLALAVAPYTRPSPPPPSTRHPSDSPA